MDGSLCVWGGRVRLVMGRGVRTVEHSFLWLASARARVRVHTILNQSVTVRESDSQSSSRRQTTHATREHHATPPGKRGGIAGG